MPSPSPSPSPTPVLVPTRGIAQELAEATGLGGPQARLLAFGVELLLLVLCYLLARWALVRVVHQLGERIATREIGPRAARVRTLAGLLNNTAEFVLGFVFLVSGLSLFGVNVAAILGTASVAGLAFGFGAQKLVKDVITGYFLLLEDQYAVGDYVTIGTVSGTVEELGMRITRVRDDDGRLFILSNGDIAQVCNHSRGPVGGSFEVSIGVHEDVATAVTALETALVPVAATLGLVEPPRVEGISAADATKTTLRLSFKVAANHRPAQVLPRLRQAAREALLEAQLALG